MWRLRSTPEGIRLGSIYVDLIWDGPVMANQVGPEMHLKFAKRKRDVEFFKRRHNHGFWCKRSLEDLWHWSTWQLYIPSLAYGKVRGYGKVVEHVEGYRAQRMAIEKLFLPVPGNPTAAAELEKVYACDVVTDYNLLSGVKLENPA